MGRSIARARLAHGAARLSDTRRLAELADAQQGAQTRALQVGASDRAETLGAGIAALEARLAVLEAAYAAQVAFGALEDAYRRPLQDEEEPRA